MNKNLLKYSSRFMAVLMASAIFTSCAKDEFTEKNALDLELRRMRVQDSIAMADSKLAQTQKIQLMQYQRMIDSLTAIDAGGKVFYSVIPVNATFTTFGSGDGRAEDAEGEDGATVTASQWGVALTATSNKNGVYTFPVLHSGEVSVTVLKAGYSTANYIANLTPTGPVANGKTVYVGNIIPIFKTSTTTSEMATVKGKAWVETDLTNTAREFAPAGTTFTAQIDVTRMSGGKSVFKKRFIEENNNQDFGVQGGNPGTGGVVGSGGTSSNGNTSNFKNGYIQRFGYEMTGLPTGSVSATGDYSFLSPASASGLPVKLEFSEFITDRTYYANNAIVTKRFAYGPNVTEDMYMNGIDPATVTFKAFETEAVVTPTYTAEAIGTTVASVTIRNKGLYLLAPIVTGATGKNATYSVDLGITGAAAKGDKYTNDAVAITGKSNSQSTYAVGLQNIYAVNVGGTNTGYVAADDQTDLTVTRTDIFNIGTGTQVGAGSTTGGIAAYIRVDNGGYGFIPNSPIATAANGTGGVSSGFTNTLPKVAFNQSSGVPFTVNTTSPTTAVIVDQTVGTISHIFTGGGGSFPSLPVVNFTYGSAASIGLSLGTGGAPNQNLFVANGTGGIQFNTSYPAKWTGATVPTGGQAQAGSPIHSITTSTLVFATSSTGTDNAGYGSGFTFVPSVSAAVTNNPTIATAASFQVFVCNDPASLNLGKITRVDLTNQGSYSSGAVANADFITSSTGWGTSSTIALAFNPVNSNTLAATAFSFGTGLTNYIINTSSTNVGTGAVITGGVNVLNLGVGSGTSGITFNTANNNTGVGLPDVQNAASFFNTANVIGGGNGVNVQGLNVGNNVLNAIQANTWLVAFDAPGSNPKTYALGLPIYDAIGGLVGVRPILGGAGYTASTNMYLIPNAYRGITSLNDLPKNSQGVVDYNVKAILDANNGAARINLSKTLARLTFAITTAGTKYSATPILTTVGGGLAFNVAYSPLVVVMDKGGIKSAGSGAGSVTTTAIEFATDPKFTDVASLRVVVIDQISEAHNKIMRDALAQQAAGAVGAPVVVKSNADGRITEIDVKATYMPSASLGYAAGTTDKLWKFFPALTFDYAPIVTVSAPIGTGGVTATATSSILYDRTDGSKWTVNMVTVTNPTTNSGYRSGNYRDVTNKFTVYGGNNGSSPAGGVSNSNWNNSGTTSVPGTGSAENVESEDNVRFDVFPGITYARDVHYGTGKEIK